MSVLYKYDSGLEMKFPFAKNKIVDPVYTLVSTLMYNKRISLLPNIGEICGNWVFKS